MRTSLYRRLHALNVTVLSAAAAHAIACTTDSPASSPGESSAPPAARAPEPPATAPAPPPTAPPLGQADEGDEPGFDGPARVQLVGRFDTTDPAGCVRNGSG